MISFQPGMHALRRAFGGAPPPDIATRAVEAWTLSPSSDVHVQPAKFLPGQLDRLRVTEFGTVAEVVRDFTGGFDSPQPPTRAFRLKDVDLVDGVLYSGGTVRHLKRRRSRVPAYVRPREVAVGALYESWLGNRWFGNWLIDDCLTYRLAERFGRTFTTGSAIPPPGHQSGYQRLLQVAPDSIGNVHFDELVLFGDNTHNAGKKARADDFRNRVLADRQPASHAGVFLLRGESGDRRILVNEREIAEKLAVERGFRILDPMTASIDAIVDACAGAQVVAGVEGSHLVHGLMLMPPGARLFVIQPPTRIVSVLKLVTDRQAQGFSFVVGTGSAEAFSVEWEEIDRTLDLH